MEKERIQLSNTYSLSLDETKAHLFCSRSRFSQRFIFPQMQEKSHFSKLQYCSQFLSADGEYIALYNPLCQLEIYHTGNLEKPILRQRFKGAETGCFCFGNKNTAFVASGHVVYALDLMNPQSIRVIYGQPLTRYGDEALRTYGHMLSIAFHNDKIFLLHTHKGKKQIITISCKDFSVLDQVLLPEAFWKYSQLLVDANGNQFLLYQDGKMPILVFSDASARFTSPDQEIYLPATYKACFSPNNQYFSAIALENNEQWTQSCWLFETNTWKPIDVIHNIRAHEVRFSIQNGYWLIGGRDCFITKIN